MSIFEGRRSMPFNADMPNMLHEPGLDETGPAAHAGGGHDGGAPGAFYTRVAADWVIEKIEKECNPQRKTWDWERAKHGTGGFRLALARPEQEVKIKERKNVNRDLVISSPIKQVYGRAEKYYQALLAAEKRREDLDRRVLEEEEKVKILQAAKQSDAKLQAAWKLRTMDGESTSTLSAEQADEDEEELDDEELETYLRPYDGQMKVEIEIAVQGPPGAPEPSEYSASVRDDESEDNADDDDRHRTGDDDEMDAQAKKEMQDEMAELMAEVQGWEEKKAAEAARVDTLDDGMDDDYGAAQGAVVVKPPQAKPPEPPQVPRMPHNHPCPQASLLLSGTAHLAPDVERLSLQPSLPIPPPPSLLGRHRLKMKPRLPLSISNNRYRDEHPFLPEETMSALNEDMRLMLAEKYRTIELYASTSQALGTMDYRRRMRSDSAPSSPQTQRFPNSPKIDGRPERYLENPKDADSLDRLLVDELYSSQDKKGIIWKAEYDQQLRDLANTDKKAKQAATAAKWAAFGGEDPFA